MIGIGIRRIQNKCCKDGLEGRSARSDIIAVPAAAAAQILREAIASRRRAAERELPRAAEGHFVIDLRQ